MTAPAAPPRAAVPGTVHALKFLPTLGDGRCLVRSPEGKTSAADQLVSAKSGPGETLRGSQAL